MSTSRSKGTGRKTVEILNEQQTIGNLNHLADLATLEEKEVVKRIKIVGASGSGAYNIMKRYADDDFKEYGFQRDEYKHDIDFKIRTDYVDGQTIKAHIYPISLAPLGVRRPDMDENENALREWLEHTDAVMLTIDLTEADPFKQLPHLIEKTRRYTNAPIVLVGTKIDAVSEGHLTSLQQEMENLNERYRLDGFSLVSAKQNVEIDAVFQKTISASLQKPKPSFEAIDKIGKACALLDVDETLLSWERTEEGRVHKINNELINELKASGIKDIYLFTNMNLGEIDSVNTAEESQSKRITRYELVQYLKDLGFNVHGVITQADVNYDKGLGAAYNDLYLDAYKNKQNNAKYDLKPDKDKYNTLADKISIPPNTSRDKQAGVQKEEMYKYFLENNTSFRHVLYIDDDQHCIEKVNNLNSSHPNGCHLVSLNSKDDGITHSVRQFKNDVIADKLHEPREISENIVIADKLHELKEISKNYENILKNVSKDGSSTSIFMRNKNFSDKELKTISQYQKQFSTIVKNMSVAERSLAEVKQLANTTKDKSTPHLLDFKCTRYKFFAAGNTSSRNKINKLINPNETKLLKLASTLKKKLSLK